MAPIEISVIVPTFNGRDVVRRTIEELQRQTFAPDAYEIIVADDGSTDGTAGMVAAIRGPAPVRYVAQPHRGRSAARNLGVEAARGRILLFLDADIWATPALLATHHRHYPPGAERIGVQGRSLTHPDARLTAFMRAREITPDLSIRRRRRLSPVHIITRNFSCLRAEVEAAGGFDEAFTGYGWEDIELAMRLQARGATFDYDPEALGYHYHAETFEDLRKKLRQCGEGAVYFWRKYGRPVRLGVFLEIHPAMLPIKWFVYRTPLFMPLMRWLRPRAERRGWLLLLNECYTELIWEAYYDGVFTALRQASVPAGVLATGGAPAREPQARPGRPDGAREARGTRPVGVHEARPEEPEGTRPVSVHGAHPPASGGASEGERPTLHGN